MVYLIALAIWAALFGYCVRSREKRPKKAGTSLHGFRRKASGRQYGDMQLAPYRLPSPPRFLWLNVFSCVDPVSGRLDYFSVDEQVHLWFARPLTAHLGYWTDRRFYEHVVTWLRSNSR